MVLTLTYLNEYSATEAAESAGMEPAQGQDPVLPGPAEAPDDPDQNSAPMKGQA